MLKPGPQFATWRVQIILTAKNTYVSLKHITQCPAKIHPPDKSDAQAIRGTNVFDLKYRYQQQSAAWRIIHFVMVKVLVVTIIRVSRSDRFALLTLISFIVSPFPRIYRLFVSLFEYQTVEYRTAHTRAISAIISVESAILWKINRREIDEPRAHTFRINRKMSRILITSIPRARTMDPAVPVGEGIQYKNK